jgi:hypothetical protein
MVEKPCEEPLETHAGRVWSNLVGKSLREGRCRGRP